MNNDNKNNEKHHSGRPGKSARGEISPVILPKKFAGVQAVPTKEIERKERNWTALQGKHKRFVSKDVYLYADFQKSPLLFIEKVWGLYPQPVKMEYRETVEKLLREGDLSRESWHPEFFESFIRGNHISWQQYLVCKAVERAIRGTGKKKITVVSGNGIGKDAVLSMLILWFLFCFKDAQVPCTAPTSDQIYDVLWKEIALWLSKMPRGIQQYYEWTMNHVRIKERPETWFARAKTASKERPEAISGIHGEHVFIAIDEASAVAEEVFKMGEGAMTAENVIVVMIGNGTRLEGTFYDSHGKNKQNWECLSFSSLESPLVSSRFIEEKIADYGEDSSEYAVFVNGTFPKADAIDARGFMRLFEEYDLRYSEDVGPFGRGTKLGIDPAGEGTDLSSFVVRDSFKAKIAASEVISTPKSVAEKAVTLADYYSVASGDITVDNFGEGANVSQEMMRAGLYVNAVNVGHEAESSDKYLNARAEVYFRLKEWLRSGGELIKDTRWKELLTIRYRRTMTGKIQIMSKLEMRKMGYKSPNFADALALTFVKNTGKSQVHEYTELSDDETNALTNIY